MNTVDSDFNFSNEPVKFGPFLIGSTSYILREASEDAYTAYRNVSMKSMKLLEGNTTVSEGGQEADGVLIQRCLFQLLNNNEVPVKHDFVRGLPRRVTRKLYDKIREISAMDVDEETTEFLTKRIERDTKKLDALKRGEDSSVKND